MNNWFKNWKRNKQKLISNMCMFLIIISFILILVSFVSADIDCSYNSEPYLKENFKFWKDEIGNIDISCKLENVTTNDTIKCFLNVYYLENGTKTILQSHPKYSLKENSLNFIAYGQQGRIVRLWYEKGKLIPNVDLTIDVTCGNGMNQSFNVTPIYKDLSFIKQNSLWLIRNDWAIAFTLIMICFFIVMYKINK